MIIDMPSTTTSAVNRKLVDLRDNGGAVALGRVLTLIIVTEDDGAEAAIEAANSASREHPCRVLVIVQANRRGVDRVDAQIRVGGDAGASEVIILRLYGRLAQHGDSVVTPLLLPDSPVVAWWPSTAPAVPSEDPIGAMAQRRITDAAETRSPRKELDKRRAGYAVGDTDLAWTRITRWRGLLAAALDQPPYLSVEQVVVTGASDSPSTDLLGAWLAETLKAPVVRARSGTGTGMASVRLQRRNGPIDLVRVEGAIATLTQPGQPDRRIALPRRPTAECLAEELRRLDPDEVYQLALSKGLGRLETGRAAGPSLDEARSRARTADRRERSTARAIAKASPSGEPAERPATTDEPSTDARRGSSDAAGEPIGSAPTSRRSARTAPKEPQRATPRKTAKATQPTKAAGRSPRRSTTSTEAGS